MTTLAALAAAGLLARICAAAPPTRAGEVKIEGNVRYDVATGRVLVEDGAVLRRGAVVLRARSASYDPATGEILAAGGVLLTDATHVLAADSVRAVLGGEVEAEGVVAFVKGEPVDLSRAADLSEARGLGRNRVSFSGARLTGDPSGRFRLSRARLTLCDCGEGKTPSWEISARDADVIAGRRAILRWPILRIAPTGRAFPVLALPWLYVPLGERQSGLLLPEYEYRGATGHVIAEPVFVTLGRSWDATLTPEWATGPRALPTDPRAGAVRGPGARLELRWAPAEAAEGQAQLAWFHDLAREIGGVGGDRFALDLAHAQRAGERTSVRAAVHLTSDGVWVRDWTSDGNRRTTPYRRSDLLVSYRRDAGAVDAGASYLQPLLPFGAVAGKRYGPLGADLDASSRWPFATATLLPTSVGPLRLSGQLGAARFAPVAVAIDESGRPAADRADARVEVGAPILVGGVLTLSPYLRGAVTGYAFEADRDPLASAWGVAGAVLSTEVSRRFGETRHAVAPRLEWRAGSAAAGSALDWPAYDLFDRSATGALEAAPPGSFQQLRAAIESRLERRGSGVLRIELGQDLDLRRRRLGETFGAASISAGPLTAEASARAIVAETRAKAGLDPETSADLAIGSALGSTPLPRTQIVLRGPLDRHFSELRGSVALADRRGDAVRAGFLSVAPGGSSPLVAGIDALFDLRRMPIDGGAYATAGVQVAVGPATLRYDATFPGRASLALKCSADAVTAQAALSAGDGSQYRRVEGWQPRQHTAGLRWVSPCRCFLLEASFGLNDCGVQSYGASIRLGALAGAMRAR